MGSGDFILRSEYQNHSVGVRTRLIRSPVTVMRGTRLYLDWVLSASLSYPITLRLHESTDEILFSSKLS